MSAEDRRADLIGVALALMREGGPDRVTMGSVAERSHVTRALVYKHFANRRELLGAVFRSESAKLEASLVAGVAAVSGFEPQLRAFISLVLRAIDSHGWMFAPFEARTSDSTSRRAQRWDRRTVRYFAKRASEELGLPDAEATLALGILFSGLGSLRSQARRMDAAERKRLEDLYVDLVMGALSRLRERVGAQR